MKTAALLALSLLLMPALLVLSIGAERETWRTVTLGAALLAFALGSIRYLLT